MPNNLFEQYLENEVMNADPLKLVQLLYRGALDAVSAARLHLSGGDIAGRSRQITKAQQILAELIRSLDHSQDAALSRDLAALYAYMVRQLAQANIGQIDLPLAEVQQLLTTLLEAWEHCIPQKDVEPCPASYAAAPEAEESRFSYSY